MVTTKTKYEISRIKKIAVFKYKVVRGLPAVHGGN